MSRFSVSSLLGDPIRVSPSVGIQDNRKSDLRNMKYRSFDRSMIDRQTVYQFAQLESFRGHCMFHGELRVKINTPHACPICIAEGKSPNAVFTLRIVQAFAFSRATLSKWRRAGLLICQEGNPSGCTGDALLFAYDNRLNYFSRPFRIQKVTRPKPLPRVRPTVSL